MGGRVCTAHLSRSTFYTKEGERRAGLARLAVVACSRVHIPVFVPSDRKLVAVDANLHLLVEHNRLDRG